jgi:hypothetical protein
MMRYCAVYSEPFFLYLVLLVLLFHSDVLICKVPQGTQQNLVKLCEDAKNYAKSIEWLLYPPIVEEKAPVEVDPFANIDTGYRTNRRMCPS